MPGTVLVVGGGDPPDSATVAALPAADLVVAADSGVDRANAIGLAVDVAIGDFDSVTAMGLLAAERAGARIIRHKRVKDETDLELAMLEAVTRGPERIIAIAIDGGRIDHYLANVALLADPRFAASEVDALTTSGALSVIHRRRSFAARVGELVTLLPVGGSAHGVRTSGFVYALSGETLTAGSPRGVSNEFAESVGVVEVGVGTVLLVRPEFGRSRSAS